MEVLQQRVERQEDAIQARGAELDALNRMYQRDLSDQFVAEEQAAGEDLPPVRLHPDFEETGLVAGLSGLLARFQKTVAIELAVDVDLQQRDRGGRDSFPERFKSGVYRIIEEALDNVVKHSGARSAHVNLGYQADGKLSLSVLDEDRGFHGSGGPYVFGLRALHEYAYSLGGVCEIESTPGHGTRVHVALPDPASG